MAFVMTLLSRKGGTSKSTTAMALAGAIQGDDETCLLVDCDPQASLTKQMLRGAGHNAENITASMTIEALAAGAATADELAIPVPRCPGVSIIPARPEMVTPERDLQLRASSSSVVLCDTAPDTRLGDTVSAVLSCDAVLLPCQPTSLAMSTLPMTLGCLSQAVGWGARCVNVGILLTQVQTRKMTVQDDCISQLRRTFGTQVLTAVLPFLVDFQEAATLGMTPWQVKKKSKGAKAAAAIWAEVMQRVIDTNSVKGAA